MLQVKRLWDKLLTVVIIAMVDIGGCGCSELVLISWVCILRPCGRPNANTLPMWYIISMPITNRNQLLVALPGREKCNRWDWAILFACNTITNQKQVVDDFLEAPANYRQPHLRLASLNHVSVEMAKGPPNYDQLWQRLPCTGCECW